ncbi:hypothetical protein PENANT_c071G00429 [Penicillium antarcticum]|uniref:Uncharacterized protein n=1 Tax=Penicillium antarcticum TaxID=416450 RepID=A0A1V6PPJ7_9EURO|nr:hypothetical protein PENANT_c071G00429 [Penicillium antarcticum]
MDTGLHRGPATIQERNKRDVDDGNLEGAYYHRFMFTEERQNTHEIPYPRIIGIAIFLIDAVPLCDGRFRSSQSPLFPPSARTALLEGRGFEKNASHALVEVLAQNLPPLQLLSSVA